MTSKKLYLLSIGILLILSMTGQDTQSRECFLSDTIPFALTDHNNIIIDAVLNQADTIKLMFHTAANDISLIEASTEALNSLIWDKDVEEVKSWGGSGEQRTSPNNTLNIGQMQWDSLLIWESRHSGPTSDGKFGPNLFSDRSIEIDFESSHLIVHKELPAKVTNYEKIPIQYENGFMFVEANSLIDSVEIKNRYLLHSGYAGAVLLDDLFVQENKVSGQIKITDESELKDSQGNILKTKKGILPKFLMGKYEFNNIPVGFFEGAIGRQKMSVIGGNILKRFNLIIDSKRENLYVKSNGLSLLSYSNG